ncbi:MAG: MBL fold metallo-hydrolase [Halobacteriaceae archaeon]
MRVTLLGTGDTTGTPTPNCDCATCERARDLGVERSRFSVHVANERTGEALLVDCSPDLRAQFLAADVALPDAAVVTHVHFDHLDGLGNAYRLLDSLAVHAADGTRPPAAAEVPAEPAVAAHVADRYDYLDRVTVHPEAPLEPFSVCGFEVTLVPVDHPPLPCYGLRVTDPETGAVLAFTGDTSYAVPPASRRALAGADLLLADAIVPASFCPRHPQGGDHHDDRGVPRTFGTKHMTREGALDLADALDAGAVRLVHASHFYPPDEAFAEPLAVDGEVHVL